VWGRVQTPLPAKSEDVKLVVFIQLLDLNNKVKHSHNFSHIFYCLEISSRVTRCLWELRLENSQGQTGLCLLFLKTSHIRMEEPAWPQFEVWGNGLPEAQFCISFPSIIHMQFWVNRNCTGINSKCDPQVTNSFLRWYRNRKGIIEKTLYKVKCTIIGIPYSS
jgi:hypothetical protein